MGGTVVVRLFAQAREAVGERVLRVAVPADGLSVEQLLADLQRRHPGLRRWLPVCRIARNGKYISPGPGRLRSGDEVAVHPPYSGG